MTRLFCAALLVLSAAGLLPIHAQTQVPDRSVLLPPADDTVETIPVAPIPRYVEVAPEIARESDIALEPSGVTRREILHRLFADRNVQIEWRNKAFADERVQDRRLIGPPVELARRLLARTSYVMFYAKSGDDDARLTRILILGSDPPSITQSGDAATSRRSAEAPAPTRRETRTSEAERRRSAIEATKRAITAAQRR
jgi:hypothetical protein